MANECAHPAKKKCASCRHNGQNIKWAFKGRRKKHNKATKNDCQKRQGSKRHGKYYIRYIKRQIPLVLLATLQPLHCSCQRCGLAAAHTLVSSGDGFLLEALP